MRQVDPVSTEALAQPEQATESAPAKPAQRKLVMKKQGSVASAKKTRVPKHVRLEVDRRPSGQTGVASWYGGPRGGHETASGESLDNHALTAAHRTLPLLSHARVTNLSNGRSVTVRITDRGPHKKDRIIDLSQSAAEKLGMRHKGLARVRVEPLSPAKFTGVAG